MPFVFDGNVYSGCLSRIKRRYVVKFTDGSTYSSVFEEKVKDEVRRKTSPVYGNGIFVNSAGWKYQLFHDKNRHTKDVRNSIAGTDEKAWKIALKYGRKVSDGLGLTRKSEIPTWPHMLKEDWKRNYVAGFLDGDGCVKVDKTSINVSTKQSQRIGEPAVVTRFKEWFPRFYTYIQMPKKPSHRPQHILKWSGEPSYFLLKCSEEHGIVKRAQSATVRPILDNYWLTGKYDWGPDGYQSISNLLSSSKMNESYAEVEIDSTRLTDAYLAGLYDAEGCLYSTTRCNTQSSLAQEVCPRVLEEIQKIAGGNIWKSRPGVLHMSGDVLVAFLQRIRPFSVQKLPQIDLALESLCLRCSPGKRLRDEVRERRQEITRELKRLKRI